jgi:hypothetical protein
MLQVYIILVELTDLAHDKIATSISRELRLTKQEAPFSTVNFKESMFTGN